MPSAASSDITRQWTTLIIIVCLLLLQNATPSATSASNNISYNANTDSASGSNVHNYNANEATSIWKDLGRTVQFVLDKCTSVIDKKNNKNSSGAGSIMILEDCLKRKSLLAIDRALSRDVISIGDGALVFEWKQRERSVPRSWSPENSSTDWGKRMREQLMQFFKTRALKIRLSSMNFSDKAQNIENFEGRGRRKGNMMAQLLMFALVAAGIIVIPMGFQFLAVLGGKALLLAKLALLLTSIQGLKKIATSQFNYGLYSHGGGGPYYDRKWPYDYDGYQNRHATGVDSYTHPDLLHPLQPRIQDILNAK